MAGKNGSAKKAARKAKERIAAEQSTTEAHPTVGQQASSALPAREPSTAAASSKSADQPDVSTNAWTTTHALAKLRHNSIHITAPAEKQAHTVQSEAVQRARAVRQHRTVTSSPARKSAVSLRTVHSPHEEAGIQAVQPLAQ